MLRSGNLNYLRKSFIKVFCDIFFGHSLEKARSYHHIRAHRTRIETVIAPEFHPVLKMIPVDIFFNNRDQILVSPCKTGTSQTKNYFALAQHHYRK